MYGEGIRPLIPVSFVRLEVGEGIEVEKKDFAEEVKSQLEG